jgi:hypothetical protein
MAPEYAMTPDVAEQVAPNENSLPHPFLDDNGINPVYQKDSVSSICFLPCLEAFASYSRAFLSQGV